MTTGITSMRPSVVGAIILVICFIIATTIWSTSLSVMVTVSSTSASVIQQSTGTAGHFSVAMDIWTSLKGTLFLIIAQIDSFVRNFSALSGSKPSSIYAASSCLRKLSNGIL